MIQLLIGYLCVNFVFPTILLLFGAYDTKKEMVFAYFFPGGVFLVILKYLFDRAKEKIIEQYKKLK